MFRYSVLIVGLLTLGHATASGVMADEILPAREGQRLAPAPPAIDRVDQAFLMRMARHAMDAALKADRPEAPTYVPESLAEVSCVVFVTLWRDGEALGSGQAGPGDLVRSVWDAAQQAVDKARAAGTALDHDALARCGLAIELLGPKELVGNGLHPVDVLAGRYEYAIDGIGVRVRGRDFYARVSQLLSREPQCREDTDSSMCPDNYRAALLEFKQAFGVGFTEDPKQAKAAALAPEDVIFYRYRATHLWQARAEEQPIRLVAGMRVVPRFEVSPVEIRSCIHQTARYLVERQKPDGFFAYEYRPGRDAYNVEEQNWVRQAGTIWTISRYARRSGAEPARRCSDKAIAAMRAMVREHPGTPYGSYLVTPDHEAKLGVTALFGLALLDAPQPERYADLASALGDAVCKLQAEGGGLAGSFVSGRVNPASQDYFPGEALLFLARLYEQTRDARWRETIDRALPFYKMYFRTAASPAFVGWQMQAYGQIARSTTLERYAQFVYAMADRLLETQLSYEHVPLCIYDGGFDVYGRGRVGISVGPYVEGLNEALRTARAFGDAERATRYAVALEGSLRMILQLQIKPEETYYMRTPEDAIGGFRTNPLNSTARIDHAQHALGATLGAYELLWPDEPLNRKTAE